MLEYGSAFAKVRINLHTLYSVHVVKIQIQPVIRFYLQHIHSPISKGLATRVSRSPMDAQFLKKFKKNSLHFL